jgi:hypothetical protein
MVCSLFVMLKPKAVVDAEGDSLTCLRQVGSGWQSLDIAMGLAIGGQVSTVLSHSLDAANYVRRRVGCWLPELAPA